MSDADEAFSLLQGFWQSRKASCEIDATPDGTLRAWVNGEEEQMWMQIFRVGLRHDAGK